MKGIIYSLLVLSLWQNACAQNASPSHDLMTRQAIVPIEDNQFSNFYYANEAAVWREQVKTNAKDENAWLNYYKASRYLNFTNQSRDISANRQSELDEILKNMKSAIPESFAFHYSSYLNGNKSKAAFEHLQKAYSKAESAAELWDDMLSLAVITSNETDIQKFAKNLSDNGTYNASEVAYNRNVLSSIEQNGILITNGNVDTYPVIMMQQLQHYRKDVRVICIEWLGNETFSKTVADWLGMKSSKSISLQKIMASASGNPLYVALTVPPSEIEKYSANLYCTGLAMKRSSSALDNLPVLASNWEKLFDKSTLESQVEINKNYLLPLVLLKGYYKKSDPQHATVSKYFEQMSKGFGLTKVYLQHKD